MTPLKNNWEKICTTVVVDISRKELMPKPQENMKLMIKMNLAKKCVEIKVFNKEHFSQFD